MRDADDYHEIARTTRSSGGGTEDVLHALRAAGATPIASLKVLCAVEGIGLDEAKRLIDDSRTWSDLRTANESLRQDAELGVQGDRDESP